MKYKKPGRPVDLVKRHLNLNSILITVVGVILAFMFKKVDENFTQLVEVATRQRFVLEQLTEIKSNMALLVPRTEFVMQMEKMLPRDEFAKQALIFSNEFETLKDRADKLASELEKLKEETARVARELEGVKIKMGLSPTG